jgi:hypothetical protein
MVNVDTIFFISISNKIYINVKIDKLHFIKLPHTFSEIFSPRNYFFVDEKTNLK